MGVYRDRNPTTPPTDLGREHRDAEGHWHSEPDNVVNRLLGLE
jgi:hypothetical protein